MGMNSERFSSLHLWPWWSGGGEVDTGQGPEGDMEKGLNGAGTEALEPALFRAAMSSRSFPPSPRTSSSDSSTGKKRQRY